MLKVIPNNKNNPLHKPKRKLSNQEEIDQMPQDIINPNLFIELKEQLYSISNDIESLGRICDKHQKSSLEEYKTHLNNERDALNNQTECIMNDLKNAIEKKKKETVPKYKRDFIDIKNKVQQLAKDLQCKEKELSKFNHKTNVLDEDDMFYSNQLIVAEELNAYLIYKYNMIIKYNSIPTVIESSNTINNNSNSEVLLIGNRNNSCRNLMDTQTRSNLLLTSLEPVKKQITKQFNLNERIMNKQLNKNQRDFNQNRSKYFRLAAMSDNNRYMSIFRTIVNEVTAYAQNSQMNKQQRYLPKIKSGGVLYRSSSSSNYSYKKSTMLDESMVLTFREKKEIVIRFLETNEVKRLIYDVLYTDKSLPFPFNKI